jgi:predicted DsbA family dithiol-disulfide isomerase
VGSPAAVIPPIDVHAWLDVACPWCWVAKRRFEVAEAEYGGVVRVEYHSFELAPDLPADYLSSEVAFLQSRNRALSRADVEQMLRVVASTGARLGLRYEFDLVRHTSTFLAHQLLHHAKASGRQLPMLEVLFSAFFARGRDLRSVEELATLSAEAGLDAADTRQALTSDRYADGVKADRALAAASGVEKIPAYVVERQPPIHGARRPVVLVAALRAAAGPARR